MDGSNNKETSAFTSICPKKSDEISAASHESSATTNTPTTTTSNAPNNAASAASTTVITTPGKKPRSIVVKNGEELFNGNKKRGFGNMADQLLKKRKIVKNSERNTEEELRREYQAIKDSSTSKSELFRKIREDIIYGLPDNVIIQAAGPDTVANYFLENIKYHLSPDRNWQMEFVVFVGKDVELMKEYALSMFVDVYDADSDGEMIWDTYFGQETILLSDESCQFVRFKTFTSLLANWPYSVVKNINGRFDEREYKNVLSKRLVVMSTYFPHEWYQEDEDFDEKKMGYTIKQICKILFFDENDSDSVTEFKNYDTFVTFMTQRIKTVDANAANALNTKAKVGQAVRRRQQQQPPPPPPQQEDYQDDAENREQNEQEEGAEGEKPDNEEQSEEPSQPEKTTPPVVKKRDTSQQQQQAPKQDKKPVNSSGKTIILAKKGEKRDANGNVIVKKQKQ